MNQNKVYIGDSVYVSFDGFMFRLTTENGLGASNEIFLEIDVLDRLNKYAKEQLEAKPDGGSNATNPKR